jgi:outer membrane protein OmpA-like peptidoglycan-associated protein
MESRLDHDFSGVRIHTDSRAAASASAVAARAYTVGQEVVFNAGEYRPHTPAGRSVIAHELAHTVQQRGTTQLARSPLRVGPVDDPCERQADAVGKEAANGDRSRTPEARARSGRPPVLRRLGDPTKLPAGGLTCPIASSTPSSVFMSIEFPQGSATLSPVQAIQLQGVIAAWEAAGTSPTIRVDGYSSTEGSDPDNWRLSCDRAYAVFAELTAYTSGPPGIPEVSIDTFAQGETSEFGPTLPPNRRVTLSSTQPLPAPVCTHPGEARALDVQPVFLRTDAADTAPTGTSWPRRLASANSIWGKVGVSFRAASPVTIDTALKSSGDGGAIAALRTGSGVEVFITDHDLETPPAAHGGAVTYGPLAALCTTGKIVMTDQGTSDTLLAHELGHILGIQHPGVPPNPGDPGTIMVGSGSSSVANATRNTMVNARAVLCPPPTASTCLSPDP